MEKYLQNWYTQPKKTMDLSIWQKHKDYSISLSRIYQKRALDDFNLNEFIVSPSSNSDNYDIVIDENCTFSVPNKLKQLENIILDSKYILDLEEDWDDNESPAYDKATWIEAVNFLIKYATWILDEQQKIILMPKISHAPKSGIDILWENDKFRILIYINQDGKSGLFYTDNTKQQLSEGQFDIEDINFKLLPQPIE